jgi:hypothetical protein
VKRWQFGRWNVFAGSPQGAWVCDFAVWDVGFSCGFGFGFGFGLSATPGGLPGFALASALR